MNISEEKRGDIFKLLKHSLQQIANIAIIIGVIFAFIQIADYRSRTSADIALKFGEYLDDGHYLNISEALDTEDKDKKIFQPEGSFSIGEIDRYLGTFETLGNLYKRELIDCETFKVNFSYYIQKAFSNEELRSYINDVDGRGEKWWPNLIFLSDVFVYEKKAGCK